MEAKKQGLFSSFKNDDFLRPATSRAKSPSRMLTTLLRRKPRHVPNAEPVVGRSGSLNGETLAPLIEGPDPEIGESKRVGSGIGNWMKGHLLSRAPSMTSSVAYRQRSDLRLLIGVMGAPLAPVNVSSGDPLPHLSIKDTPI
ncbi:hypothetical protein SSX86_030785, partial [Deinandra increscens subsp. villosa]